MQIAKGMASVKKDLAIAQGHSSGHWNDGGYLYDDEQDERLYKVQGCALVDE